MEKRRRRAGSTDGEAQDRAGPRDGRRAFEDGDRGRLARRGDAVALPQLCTLGHHLARPARRPRRSEAGPASHPLRDVGRPRRPVRRPLHEVRGGRGRGDEELSPPRRPVDLSGPGPDGPAVQPALPPDRGLRQLRLDRRRRRGRDAVHRVPPHADRRGTPVRAESGDGQFPSQLRIDDRGTGGPPGAVSQSPDQRDDRDRRRHGDQHPAAQPQGGLRGA